MPNPTSLTIVDLTLHAASICQFCRQGTRPADESDQEHGDSFYHHRAASIVTAHRCQAEAIWVLIRRLESANAR